MLTGQCGLSDEEHEENLRICKQFCSLTPAEEKSVAETFRRNAARREDASSAKRDAREEETLSIARDSLSVAKEAKDAAWLAARWAMWAAIIATIAAIVATFKV